MSVPQYTSQLLCLDLLLAFVNHMAHRAGSVRVILFGVSFPRLDTLLRSRLFRGMLCVHEISQLLV